MTGKPRVVTREQSPGVAAIIGPRRESEVRMNQLDASLSPYRQELVGAVDDLVRLVALTHDGFARRGRPALKEAEELAHRVHEFEKEFSARIVREGSKEGVKLLLALAGHVERIGDCMEAVVRTVRAKITEGTLFSDKAVSELSQVFEATRDLLSNVRDAALTGNAILLEHVVTGSDKLSEVAAEFSTYHQERLICGICQPRHSSLYLDIMDNLRASGWHAREMALKLKQ